MADEIEGKRVKIDAVLAEELGIAASATELLQQAEARILEAHWTVELYAEISDWTFQQQKELAWSLDSYMDYGVCDFSPMIAGAMTRMGLLDNRVKLAYMNKLIWEWIK